MTVTIRPAGPGDEAVLVRLTQEMAAGEEDVSPIDEHYARHFLASPVSGVLLAEEAGEAVGLLSYALVPGLYHAADSGLIELLIVTASHRGRGVGRSLVDAALRVFREAGCAEASVSTGEANDPAQHVYREAGLTEDVAAAREALLSIAPTDPPDGARSVREPRCRLLWTTTRGARPRQDHGDDSMSASRQPRRAAGPVTTTTQRVIVPDPPPAGAEKLLPCELAKYEENGYGRWSYGPGLAAEQPARPACRPGYDDAAATARRQAAALLRHHRHPHHRRAVARPRRSSSATRASSRRPTRASCCTRTTCSTPPCRRSTRCTRRTRSTSASRWATRATTRSTTSCAGTSTCSTASTSTRTRACGATGTRAARRLPRRLRGGRAGPVHPLVPGARQPRPLLDWVPARRRLPAGHLLGETILDLGNVFEDPLGPDSRGFYMGCLDGRTPYGDIFGLGPGRGLRDAAQGAGRRPGPPLPDEERVDAASSSTTSSTPHGHGFDEADVEPGFACYTFEPKADVPIRVLVLDDTQRDDDPYDNGYGHISLDEERHDWLVRELDRGQADGVLMIIAAHCPIGVEKAPHPMAWSSSAFGVRGGAAREAPRLPEPHPVDRGPSSLQRRSPRSRRRTRAGRSSASGRSRPRRCGTSRSSSVPSRSCATATTRSRSSRSTSTRWSRTGSPAATSRTYAVAAQQIFDNEVGLLPSGRVQRRARRTAQRRDARGAGGPGGGRERGRRATLRLR